MPQYLTLRIDANVVVNFRAFSKNLGLNQSETLQHFLVFFETTQLSPVDPLSATFGTFEKKIFKRFDQFLAVLKNIEKNSILPTRNRVEFLFDNYKEPTDQNEKKHNPIDEKNTKNSDLKKELITLFKTAKIDANNKVQFHLERDEHIIWLRKLQNL